MVVDGDRSTCNVIDMGLDLQVRIESERVEDW
jgi:hypothetical protein